MYVRYASLHDIAGKLRNGELDLISYINDACDWIDKTEPIIEALLPERNRRKRLLLEAGLLLKKFPLPSTRPQLFGVLVGIKDLFNIDGFDTQAGSSLPPELFQGIESAVVTELKKQGALILGKTVSTEFAYFQPGPTSNPLNPNHTPGGSSSGSAAAVAAGFCPLAFGTQTIGSIIRPASYCGIAGFKPSFGRLSTSGVFPFSQSADHIGFMTQTLEDLTFASSVIIPGWKTLPHPEKAPIIGVPTGPFMEQADQETMASFLAHVMKLGDAGFEIVDLDLFPDIEDINSNHKKLIAYEFALNHTKLYSKYSNLYSVHSRKLYMEGTAISTQEHKNLVANQLRFRNHIEGIMDREGIDIWLCPSTIGRAPKGLASTGSPLMSLPWTHAGLPSLTIPLISEDNPLPLGLQVISRFNSDEFLFVCSRLLAKM